MKPRIRFCGAAGTVTGSCYLVTAGDVNFLVDCGMFQGTKTLKQLNYGDFPFDPASLDFVLLTHAHIDHSGLIPRLIKKGFRGFVQATGATRDLLAYMLPDSGYIQEMEVEFLNRRNRQRGLDPVEPIYTAEDGEHALSRIRSVPYEHWIEPAPGIRVRFWNAGHILGSASLEVEILTREGRDEKVRIVFSGDIGPDNKLFHPDPDAPAGVDYVISESTYGGKVRERLGLEERRTKLAAVVEDAIGRGGVLLIPAFAVERTQELLADLAALISSGRVRQVPVFLDSPLAIRATEVFSRHAGHLHDLDHGADDFNHPAFHFTETVHESRSIDRYSGGAIIIAASGMCEAGRIRHHLKHFLWRSETTVLMVGYQAPGTLGRILMDGAKMVKIQGEDIRVRAHIQPVDWYSAHADGAELADWIKARLPINAGLFLTHGEPEPLAALKADALALGIAPERIVVPAIDDEYVLDGSCPACAGDHHRLPASAALGDDWHNRFADLSIRLRQELEAAPDDDARAKILDRLAAGLKP
ncbi:MBL fold metallo-hydrolase [Gimibacter soli]|uniref:MBL fold metallo-hydrolase n=1 Tax=Gimibacter soli TaxID=3024400 RepID=A0AAE9XSC0_9PROT|nr:MBL fold metallo-hydrolase [Gimibacter soli]WCL54115.1 MBL fold metallo-hydrolase [Gimibacter soli]